MDVKVSYFEKIKQTFLFISDIFIFNSLDVGPSGGAGGMATGLVFVVILLAGASIYINEEILL
jgi:hypothetical protein